MLNHYALPIMDFALTLTPSGSIGFALGIAMIFAPPFLAVATVAYWTRP